MESLFTKNDESFICKNCGAKVEKLGYTSRDHCPNCLYSLHLDINPGDRSNDCLGIMKPIAIEYNSKKGYIITYKCEKCGQIHKNKSAKDDNSNAIMQVIKNTSYK